MWCLETIVALNEAAEKRAKNGESILLAYKDCGINGPSEKEPEKPKEEKRIRVA